MIGTLLFVSFPLAVARAMAANPAPAERRLLVFLALAASGALAAFLLARARVSRAVRELVASARQVGAGDLRKRVPVRGRGGLARLALEFNAMCERLEQTQRSLLEEQEERRRVEARLREAEHLASIGRLAAGLAHEIGTPLNVISGRTESLLRRGGGDESASRSLRIIGSQIERIARTVRAMLDFARAHEPRLALSDVTELIRDVLDLVEQRFEQARVRVTTSIAPDLPAVAVDADQIQEVFLNLALNAADAMPAGGELRIAVERVSRRRPEREEPSRPFVAVAFEDTGTGVAAENLGRVFDPFFTTKEIGVGTGLGLSIAYGIVSEHGGWIELESAPGRGARATVFLPLEPLGAPAGAGARAC